MAFLEWLNFTYSNIVLYLISNDYKMTTSKKQNLSLKFASYLFIALAIFTAFSSSNGTWV